jgi:hypothetical protein
MGIAAELDKPGVPKRLLGSRLVVPVAWVEGAASLAGVFSSIIGTSVPLTDPSPLGLRIGDVEALRT